MLSPHSTHRDEVNPMPSYWLTANGRPIGLPFDDLEVAKEALLQSLGEDETMLLLVEVYDADRPVRQLMWGSDVQDWIEVRVPPA
jgi:hypothetical protein